LKGNLHNDDAHGRSGNFIVCPAARRGQGTWCGAIFHFRDYAGTTAVQAPAAAGKDKFCSQKGNDGELIRYSID